MSIITMKCPKNKRKDLSVSPVFRILFVQDNYKVHLEQLIKGYGHLAELCILDREEMDEVEQLLYQLDHCMPFIILSTGEGTPRGEENDRILRMLDEERVLATVWNCIKKEVSLFPRHLDMPVYSHEGERILEEQDRTNHMYGPEDPPQRLQREELRAT